MLNYVSVGILFMNIQNIIVLSVTAIARRAFNMCAILEDQFREEALLLYQLQPFWMFVSHVARRGVSPSKKGQRPHFKREKCHTIESTFYSYVK